LELERKAQLYQSPEREESYGTNSGFLALGTRLCGAGIRNSRVVDHCGDLVCLLDRRFRPRQGSKVRPHVRLAGANTVMMRQIASVRASREAEPKPLRRWGHADVEYIRPQLFTQSSAEVSSTDKSIAEVLSALRSHGVSSSTTVRVGPQHPPGRHLRRGRRGRMARDTTADSRCQHLRAGYPHLDGPSLEPCPAGSRTPRCLLGRVRPRWAHGFARQSGHLAVVGNEDRAHHVAAELFQGLSDVGFTIPASGMTYWVGEAMHKTDYEDLASGSEETDQATRIARIWPASWPMSPTRPELVTRRIRPQLDEVVVVRAAHCWWVLGGSGVESHGPRVWVYLRSRLRVSRAGSAHAFPVLGAHRR
jgi:hypothetical protein